MSAPKFLFNNVITETNVTADTHYQDFTVQGAVNTLTYDYWAFDDNTAQVDIEYSGMVNGLGLVLSNALFSLVTVYVSANGADYTEVSFKSNMRNGANFFTFPDTWGNYWRITFEKAVPSIALVKNLTLGMSLEFERCLMGTHNPAPYNRSTQFVSNQSGTGEFLGRSSASVGFETGYNFGMIAPVWARNQLQEFVTHAQTGAYYVLWNDELYPDESFYGWTDADIGLSYTGDAALMSASWDARGIATVTDYLLLDNLILLETGDFMITEDGQFMELQSG
jgi:hypothetical protein